MTGASYLLQILQFMHKYSKITGIYLSTAGEERVLSAVNCTGEKKL